MDYRLRFMSAVSACLCLMLMLGACAATREEVAYQKTQDSEIVWPQPPQAPRIRYLQTISGTEDMGGGESWLTKTVGAIFGKGARQLHMLRPYGVFADSAALYVTDPGISVLHIFDMKEKKYRRIHKAGEAELVSPIGIAVDADDIYLSDSVMRKIYVFDKKGTFLREIGSPDVLVRPAGIAVREGRLYVVDTHAHKILVFGKTDGELLFTFGKNGSGRGEFNYPTNIFAGREGVLYITDSLNSKVQMFSEDGGFISSFGKYGDGSGDLSKPKGVAADSEGHIYVADAHFDNVQIFDPEGRFLLSFGRTGRARGEFVLPAGLFVDGRDKIYVADSYNKRVQIFQYLKEDHQ